MTRDLYFYEALNEALAQRLSEDPRTILMGEDIGKMGGPFWVTKGLLERFGPERVRDTPISETAFLGMASGMALGGLHPIVEVQLVDFALVALDTIVNELAKFRYMSGGQARLPVVIRAAVGGYYGDAAQHSQTLYATLAHFPGISVVVPSNPHDAKGLLLETTRKGSPCVFLEHKQLYGVPFMAYGTKGPVPEEPYTVPLGEAQVVRPGSDASLVSVGYGVHLAVEAAKEAAERGKEVEVIDLRSLKPLDTETVRRSARKTGRVLVVDEDYMSYGLSGEIAAVLLEDALTREKLREFARVAIPDVPIPFSEPLEEAVLPSVSRITEALKAWE